MVAAFKIFLFLTVLIKPLMHPVHVSITNMDYDQYSQTISLSFKVHFEDVRLLFYHLNQKDIDLTNDSVYNVNKELVDNYFANHFKLTGDGEINLKLISEGIQVDEDDIWFNYHCSIISEIKILKVSNTLLLDLYFDQKNLLIFKNQNLEKGYHFDYETTEIEINLE